MNWDWEKLRENQQKFTKKKDGGGPGMPPIPPQMEEFFSKFRGFKLPGVFLVVIVLLALFFGKSTFFTIELDEVGVIQRFGKYNRIAQPGLSFKLPSGIEKVTKVKIKRVYKEEFGFKTVQGSSDFRFSNESGSQEISLMLTGDLNVAVVPWSVQYRIANPVDYLFKVKWRVRSAGLRHRGRRDGRSPWRAASRSRTTPRCRHGNPCRRVRRP